jgi:iron complex outermembrane receptor protein
LQYHDTLFLVGVEAPRYDKQTDTASFEEATAGYTMADADFRWRIERARGMPLDLFVKASNLSDEEARKHTSFVKDVAPLPGRNYAVGVRTSW